MERRLKEFAEISLRTASVLFSLGIATLISSVIFSYIKNRVDPLIWLGITLGLFSLALGCLSVYFSDKSDKKVQAIADMKFDEIIGLMNPVENLPSPIERTVNSIRSALRISEWASPDSKSIFSVEFRKFIDLLIAQGINEELVLVLERIWREHEIDNW